MKQVKDFLETFSIFFLSRITVFPLFLAERLHSLTEFHQPFGKIGKIVDIPLESNYDTNSFLSVTCRDDDILLVQCRGQHPVCQVSQLLQSGSLGGEFRCRGLRHSIEASFFLQVIGGLVNFYFV